MTEVLLHQPDILCLILEYVGSHKIAEIFRHYVPYEYLRTKLPLYRTLIYGDIQSGKTACVVSFLKRNPTCMKIIVVQNSCKAMSQYCQRLSEAKLPFMVVGPDSRPPKPREICVLMNNKSRYAHFNRLFEGLKYRFDLFIDESDQTMQTFTRYFGKQYMSQCIGRYDITATPYGTTLKMPDPCYNRVLHVKKHPDYCGLGSFAVEYEDELQPIVQKFMGSPTGILLHNRCCKVEHMRTVVKQILALECVAEAGGAVAVVLLSTKSELYRNGQRSRISDSKSVSDIIDGLADCSHIIFVANRMANRTVSFVSGDRKRHITMQATRIRKGGSIVNFMQGLRICGIYSDKSVHPLTLILPLGSERRYGRYFGRVAEFNPRALVME